MNLTIEIIGLVAGCLAVCGVVLNNRRLRACFLLWMISNALTGGLHLYSDLWTLAARDVVFFVLAIEGWVRWGKKE